MQPIGTPIPCARCHRVRCAMTSTEPLTNGHPFATKSLRVTNSLKSACRHRAKSKTCSMIWSGAKRNWTTHCHHRMKTSSRCSICSRAKWARKTNGRTGRLKSSPPSGIISQRMMPSCRFHRWPNKRCKGMLTRYCERICATRPLQRISRSSGGFCAGRIKMDIIKETCMKHSSQRWKALTGTRKSYI